MPGKRPIVQIQSLSRYFDLSKGFFKLGGMDESKILRAVDNVSFDLFEGKTTGLVGESGCGKSTVARLMTGLLRPTSGKLLFKGQDMDFSQKKTSMQLRRTFQMIFQDPYGSLDPRMRLKTIIERPVKLHTKLTKEERRDRIIEILDLVGLNEDQMIRFPHEFSGGQRQRISIARALAVEPKVLVCDEPVSALDVSIQARILNLLQQLQERLSVTYLFISHDLSVVEHMSDQIIVMYLGNVMEISPASDLYTNPKHPYTQGLIDAVPRRHAAGKRKLLTGDVEAPIGERKGCPFVKRCPVKLDRCAVEDPPNEAVGKDHVAACHNIR